MTQPEWYKPPREPVEGPSLGVVRSSTPTEPAGFWIRGGARILDMIVGFLVATVGAFIGAFVGVFIATLRGDVGWESRLETQSLGDYAWSFAGSLLYHTLAEGIGGATVGKLVCGLRVLREDDSPATIPSGLVRTLGYYIDALFFGAVAWGSMSKSERKQRLGDKWAGTVVVHAKSIDTNARRNPAIGLFLGIAAWLACVGVSTFLKTL